MSKVRLRKNGPAILEDALLKDQDGNILSSQHVTALCRCGASGKKPFCDGSHAAVHFNDERKAEPDHGTIDYKGQRITVHDNRFICSSFGACHLKNVFEPGTKPWITPDGAKHPEDVIRIVKQCPSGALTYTVNEDWTHKWFTEPEVVVEHLGPLQFRGNIELQDSQHSAELLITDNHYTICRCGQSNKKPLCDGTHKRVWKETGRMNTEIKQENNRFYIEENGEMTAEIVFSPDGENTIVIEHTVVSEDLRGQGIGEKLVRKTVEYARKEGKKIHPQCSYASALFEKHEEFQDVLA